MKNDTRAGLRLRSAAALFLTVAVLAFLPFTATPASAAEGDPVVTLQPNTSGCNGVRPTPGSENTTKRLDPDFPSDFNPGGTVGYIIDYPVDPSDVAGRTTFVITDCVFVGDKAVAKYEISFVPNTTSFQLRFSVPIPSDTQLGSQFCNYAKTTAAPSTSQASNRKAGPACFTVGGALRIEKRSGSATGALLPGATFTVVCSPTTTQPPTIITGLSNASHTNPDATVSASGVSATGSIAIVGPSGTPCTVTETAAPAGYDFDPAPRNVTIPVGQSQTVVVFVNTLQTGDLVIAKTTTGGTGTFTFTVDCDDDSFDQTLQITDSGSATVSDIPVGTTCTVTETPNPDFLSSPAGPQVVVIANGNNTVSFTNSFIPRTGALTISKTTVGGSGTFTFTLDCDGTEFDQTFQITDSGSVTIQNITVGISCTVTETQDPHFVITPSGSQTVTVTEGVLTISFTNTFISTVGCTRTQGYYSSHPNALTSLTLGGVTLSKNQIRSILRSNAGGNYLLAVEQQLIAALLNQASGATVPGDVQAAIDAAQALIAQQGGPLAGTATSQTTVTVNGTTYTASQLNQILTSFNEGTFPGGSPHCPD